MVSSAVGLIARARIRPESMQSSLLAERTDQSRSPIGSVSQAKNVFSVKAGLCQGIISDRTLPVVVACPTGLASPDRELTEQCCYPNGSATDRTTPAE